ncbi:MAG: response regulator [Candidatus Sulfotelmatobacter sp.]|jgi:CheY-like chemotaxis protein
MDREETTRVSEAEIVPAIASAELAEAILGTEFSSSVAAGGSESILLVEDEAFVRTVTAEVLQSAGYRVTLAATAAEALRSLEMQQQDSEFVDLLLVDVVLPGKSGYEISTVFAALCPGGKILLMTGHAEHLASCDRFTADQAYLAKPFTAETLLRKVRAALH